MKSVWGIKLEAQQKKVSLYEIMIFLKIITFKNNWPAGFLMIKSRPGLNKNKRLHPDQMSTLYGFELKQGVHYKLTNSMLSSCYPNEKEN